VYSRKHTSTGGSETPLSEENGNAPLNHAFSMHINQTLLNEGGVETQDLEMALDGLPN
jgi:hypothetical protein